MLWILGMTLATFAQDTRQEQLAEQRREKAASLRPQELSMAERVLDAMGNFPMLSDSPHGPYPLMGGLMDGAGWLKVGVAYRSNFGDANHVVSHARVSNEGYWRVGSEVQIPDLVVGRLALRLDTSHLHARDVSYYGLGNTSSFPDDPGVFGMEETTAGLTATARTSSPFLFGGRAAYEHVTTGPASPQEPSFSPNVGIEDAPGFGRTIAYVHSEVFADLDWRESPGYTRRGGRSRLGLHQYSQVNGDESSFTRVDAEVAQHFPFLHGNRVVASHALVSLTSAGSGQTIPHYLLPYVGGQNSVRSLPTFRFRDRHRLLFNAEYRWRASEMVDMVLFGDAGKVAATTSDLDLNELQTSVGISIRLHGPTFTAFRLAFAYGTEGGRVLFGLGPVF